MRQAEGRSYSARGGGDAEQVELPQLDDKSIRIAEYLTELRPLDLLCERLHRAIIAAREQAVKGEGSGEFSI